MTTDSEASPPMSQLRWRCRRGMLELDVMLTRFLEQHYVAATRAEQQTFVELLACEDDQLWDWLSGRSLPDETERKQLVEQIRRPAAH